MRSKKGKLAGTLTVLCLVLACPTPAPGSWFLQGGAKVAGTGVGPGSLTVELSSACAPETVNCLAGGTLATSGVSLTVPPGRKMTFAGLDWLSASFMIKEWDCGAGSPRFVLGIDMNGDGRVDAHVFVYIGPYPGFSGCQTGVWEDTGNLVANADPRFDISQLVPDAPRVSYGEAVSLLGTAAAKPVKYVLLVVDGGWVADQVVCVDEIRVNRFRFIAPGPETR